MATPQSYNVLVGLDTPTTRYEIGAVATDIPAESVKWLLDQGIIEPADTPKKAPKTPDTPADAPAPDAPAAPVTVETPAPTDAPAAPTGETPVVDPSLAQAPVVDTAAPVAATDAPADSTVA